MAFAESIVLYPGQEKVIRATQGSTPLGQRAIQGDRVFHYALAGAVALATGRLVQEAVVVSGHDVDLLPTVAAAVGARTVTLQNVTTAIVANEYAGGFLWVNDVDGEGHAYRIKSHPAATATGTVVITLEDDDTIRVALTTSSQVGLRHNLYRGLLVNPTTPTGAPVGVTPVAVTADYYFWCQTWGPASVLTNGTLLRGRTVAPGATTAGSVDVYPLNSVDGSGQEPVVGVCMVVGVSTDFSLIDLRLAP